MWLDPDMRMLCRTRLWVFMTSLIASPLDHQTPPS